MKLFKKYELGMWHVHAFESDGSQDSFITSDMQPITEEEADLIRVAPPSAEFLENQRRQIDALGNIKIWPPREFKEALGQICVNSAMFESSLRTLIWAVAGLGSDTGIVFTGGKKRIDDLLEMLELLIRQRDSSFWQQLKPLVEEGKKAFQKRGEFVHSVWTVGSGGQPFIGKFFTEKKPREGRDLSLKELEELALKFTEVQGQLMHMVLSRFVHPAR